MNQYEEFVGKVLDGRYKILELVGMGGMACVLKAQDLVMNRIVAIKILNDEYNGNEQAEARFIDESKAVAMLSNKNIVSVYDVAIYPDIKYIVMEYLDGITFREYLDNKGSIGWKEACVYILQILRALEHAHSKGIIHRDIKPQNVMLMKNGDIKVTDFGIAKLPNSVAEQTDEKAIGTVYYISPEQACGKETDYYSDIYSVGIMLYEAVTGTLPFTAESPMEIAMMQVNDDPINPRDIVLDIPVGVSQIILKAMEKDPNERFQSAHTMAKAIEWVLRNPGVIFAMSAPESTESPIGGSVVSIDMIDTAEIEPYSDEEIAGQGGKVKKKGPAGKTKTAKTKSKPKKKAKANRSMFPIICGVAIPFFIVVAVLGVTLLINWVSSLSAEETEEEIYIPNYIGRYWDDELKSELYKQFDVIVEYETNNNKENNTITQTNPEPEALKKKPDNGKKLEITITVNKSEKSAIPTLAGLSKRIAEMQLGNLGFEYEFIPVDSTKELYQTDGQFGSENNYIQKDTVIRTEPTGGTIVQSGSTVKVYIYSGQDNNSTAKMPNLYGLTQDEAARLCANAGFVIDQVSIKTVSGGNGTIVEQSVVAGTKKAKDNNTVNIVIGSTPQTMIDISASLEGSRNYTVTMAQNEFSLLYPDPGVVIIPQYLVADESDRGLVESITANATDLGSCKTELISSAGCRIDTTFSTGYIVYQSIKPGEEIIPAQDANGNFLPVELKVLVVRYVSSSTTVPGGEDPGETSGGEISEVSPWA